MLAGRKKYILIVALVILLVAGSTYALQHHRKQSRAETTSTSPTAQSDYTGGTGHTSNPSDNSSQGGAKDNHGDSSATGDDAGVSSSSGVVTVVSPATGASLKAGDTIRGTASGVDKVQYRLVDDNVGVVAQGSLAVVNGTFSGTLQFKAHAQTGRLDVYTFDSAYQEINEVQLDVALGS